MRDLTKGPIPGHLVAMAAPIAAGMLAQTLYFLIDLYFVAQLGDAALAGVGAAGTAMFVVMALTQTLGVGTMALVSQAVGRKDPADADLVFNQAMSLAIFCTAATLVGGYLLVRLLHADRRRGRDDHRGRHHLPRVVHAGARDAVREHGDDLGPARHGRRAADDGGPDRDRAAECAAGADPDRRLAHGKAPGRCRRGAREHARGRGGHAHARALLPQAREVHPHPDRDLAPATRRSGAA